MLLHPAAVEVRLVRRHVTLVLDCQALLFVAVRKYGDRHLVFTDGQDEFAGFLIQWHADDADGDLDGWLDLLIANDTARNFLFRNRRDGSFEEVGAFEGLAFDRNGKATGAMGIDAAHYRNDAELGVAIGNFANEMTALYRNEGNFTFADADPGLVLYFVVLTPCDPCQHATKPGSSGGVSSLSSPYPGVRGRRNG